MTRFGLICSATALLVLAACGGGGTGGGTSEPLPDGRPIETTRFQFYKNDHNSRNRIRRTLVTDDQDRLVLQQFEQNAAPQQYKNLLAVSNQVNQATMNLEVVAEVKTVGGHDTVLRVLRLTADQAPFNAVPLDQLADPNGVFYFRGQTEVYSILADGTFIRSRGELVNMSLDFRNELAVLDMRTPRIYGTGEDAVEQLETSISAEVRFNVRTGAFGGQITMDIYEDGVVTPVGGELRGNVHATQHMLRQDVEGMTTSGLYSVGGGPGSPLRADGIFWGRHPNR